MNRERNDPPASRRPSVRKAPLRIGQQIRDRRHGQTGVILDFACQYTHPGAEPVYSYLIQWEDAGVQALCEEALDGGHGFVVED